MPPVPVPNNQYMLGQLSWMKQQIQAMAVQQQSIISNLSGQPVIATGLSPGSNPPQYGFQLLSQAFGSEVGFFGEDANGNVALKFRNSSGQVVVQLDVDGLQLYNAAGHLVYWMSQAGITFFDGSVPGGGNILGTFDSYGLNFGPARLNAAGLTVFNGTTAEMVAGEISSSPSIYGLAVRNTAGTMQQVGGVLYGTPTGASNVTNTTWTSFSPAGGQTVEIGPSGEAEVYITGHISTGTTSQWGSVGLSIDGAAPSGYPTLYVGGTATSGISVASTVSFTVTGLSAGSHTLAPQYETGVNGSATVSFSNVQMSVQPL